MKAFLAIKYYDDMRNMKLIEKICETLKGIDVFAFARSVQNYKKCDLMPTEIMQIAFNEIKSSNVFIIEASELSVGIGIEAGYAYTHKVPIYLIANKKSNVSNSIKGISSKILFYEDISEISDLFKS